MLDPESVKAYLASAELSENRKEKLTHDLTRFYRYNHIRFEKPNYRRIEKLPFIPLGSEVDQLISGVGKKTATFLQLLRETGARSGEAWNLRWVDIDFEKHTVNITPEKDSRAGQLRISSRLTAMLQQLSHSWECVFRDPKVDPLGSMRNFHRNFRAQRKNLASRLVNPRLNSISFRTLRHFKATIEYHRTRDILHVMQLLGHKSIRNTLVYIHLVSFESDDFVCKVAKTVEEAKALIEDSFEYVTDVEGLKLFRKRK